MCVTAFTERKNHKSNNDHFKREKNETESSRYKIAKIQISEKV